MPGKTVVYNLVRANTVQNEKRRQRQYARTMDLRFFLVVLLPSLLLLCFPTMVTAASENGSRHTKTVYLIRHAESIENERLASFKTAVRTLSRFGVPNRKDVTAACGLFNVSENVDSHLSDFGRRQIEHMATVLKQSDFVRRSQIQLVAHSPLIRARETCRGMLGCLAPDLKSAPCVEKVLELDLLIEKTPAEWIPGNYGSLEKRLRALEDWVAAQTHTVICFVGHSQFFKALLELDYKFGNCDVMEVQFNAGSSTNDAPDESKRPKWTNLKVVHPCRLQPSTENADAATAAVADETK